MPAVAVVYMRSAGLLAFDLNDGLIIIGITLMAAGAAMVFVPAAFMLTGVLLFALAAWPFLHTRSK